jgi:hypothetical protein
MIEIPMSCRQSHDQFTSEPWQIAIAAEGCRRFGAGHLESQVPNFEGVKPQKRADCES